jgi:hypothetical protein
MEAVLLKEVAAILNLPERDIERESLKTFLEEKLKKLLIEQFQLTQKYGVKNVDEMETFYAAQKLSEKESWEDFFELSHIEAEIVPHKRDLTTAA